MLAPLSVLYLAGTQARVILSAYPSSWRLLILSAAKDLTTPHRCEILRCAQDDTSVTMTLDA
jgi:hypothetical protein